MEADELPFWRKLCFAVGGIPYIMTITVIGFFLNLFLLEVAEVSNSCKSFSAALPVTPSYFFISMQT
jgi:hypothetical protein